MGTSACGLPAALLCSRVSVCRPAWTKWVTSRLPHVRPWMAIAVTEGGARGRSPTGTRSLRTQSCRATPRRPVGPVDTSCFGSDFAADDRAKERFPLRTPPLSQHGTSDTSTCILKVQLLNTLVEMQDCSADGESRLRRRHYFLDKHGVFIFG